MIQRLIAGLLVLAAVVCAQRRVDPQNTYNRVICVVPMVGSGTPADPRRPMYAPWPPAPDPDGILAFVYLPSDDGKSAVVEFVARNRSAFQKLMENKSVKVFERGRVKKGDIQTAIAPFRRGFDLDQFGVVMP